MRVVAVGPCLRLASSLLLAVLLHLVLVTMLLLLLLLLLQAPSPSRRRQAGRLPLWPWGATMPARAQAVVQRGGGRPSSAAGCFLRHSECAAASYRQEMRAGARRLFPPWLRLSP